jgi:thiol-disulfide isomerase/thioredoxin
MNTFIIALIVILAVLFIYDYSQKESFGGTEEPVKIMVFVSKTCGHCVKYNDEMHDKVAEYAKNKGHELVRLFSDDDTDNLFDKFDIQYVPACVIMKGNKITKLNSQINPDNLDNEIKNI